MSLLLLMSCGFFLWQPTVILFIAKYFSSFFSVQAVRGGVDRKPLTMEFLKKSFESSSVDPSLEDNREYQLAK